MTPFARLSFLEKVATAQPSPGYQAPAPPKLVDPYAAPVAAPTGKPWGTVNNMWGDLALSSIPFVGTAYMGNRAIQDYRYGNIAGGLGNSVGAALSILPGVGVAKGIAGGALKGVGAAVKGGLKGMGYTGPLGVKGMLGSVAGAEGIGMLGSSPPDYTKPAPPMNPWLRAGMMAMGAPGLIGGGMNLIDSYRQLAQPAYKTPTTPAPMLNPSSPAGSLNRAMTSAVVNNGMPPAVPTPDTNAPAV